MSADGSEKLGCLGIVLRLFQGASRSQQESDALPYQRKDYFFSQAERSFYGVLRQVVGARYVIFAKVRLSDLLLMPAGTSERQAHQNRIQSKHVDFVLCEPQRVQPRLVIELDDSSHARVDRQARDAFVDRALSAAGLPILHVRAQRAYSVQDLADRITQAEKPQSSERN